MATNVSQQVEAFVGQILDPARAQQAFGKLARAAMTDAEAQNERALGRKPRHTTLIDRVSSSDDKVEQVRPGG